MRTLLLFGTSQVCFRVGPVPRIRPEFSSPHFCRDLLIFISMISGMSNDFLLFSNQRHLLPFFPPPFSFSLFSCDFSSLSEFVYCLSRRSDSLTSLLVLSCSISPVPHHPPPVPAPLLPVSSSKRVFGCQCQSVGGGDDSVALTASLAMTISADCHISLCGAGGGGGGFQQVMRYRFVLTLLFVTAVNMMGDGLVCLKMSLTFCLLDVCALSHTQAI